VGIRLYVEVLDFAPTTLTHREKLTLAVLAEDAPDKTRITWSSVEDPKILRRAKVTRPQMYEVLKALTAKGAIKKLSAGQKNATAKYMLLPLAPTQGPETPDTDADSQCPDSADTDAPQRPQIPDPEPSLEGPEIPDADASQCPEIPGSVSGNPGRLPHNPTTKRSLPPRNDVERICAHLADKIAANGSKRPRITDRWRTAARLLLDNDGRTVDQVMRAIDWCQADAFWRANVMSMPKLRERYDQLRLKASAEQEQQRRAAAALARTNPNTYAEKGIF
jgi:hypothetical protein